MYLISTEKRIKEKQERSKNAVTNVRNAWKGMLCKRQWWPPNLFSLSIRGSNVLASSFSTYQIFSALLIHRALQDAYMLLILHKRTIPALRRLKLWSFVFLHKTIYTQTHTRTHRHTHTYYTPNPRVSSGICTWDSSDMWLLLFLLSSCSTCAADVRGKWDMFHTLSLLKLSA